MTVYVTSDELLDIEHARLTCAATTAWPSTAAGWCARRSRLVLADLEANGRRQRAGPAADRGVTRHRPPDPTAGTDPSAGVRASTSTTSRAPSTCC